MTASRGEIESWVRGAKANGCSHVLIVTDTYDYENYPIYVGPHERTDVHEEIARVTDRYNMQKVEEVYDLSLDIDMQMAERRAWHP